MPFCMIDPFDLCHNPGEKIVGNKIMKMVNIFDEGKSLLEKK